MKTFILILCIFGSFFSQSQKEQHMVTVKLEIDQKEVELKDDFKLYFILDDSLKKTTIEPKITSNTFINPNFPEGTKGIILFTYKKEIIGLDNVYFRSGQEMNWKFGIDNKPFNEDLVAGSSKEIVSSTSFIVYLEYQPLEKGDGTIITAFVNDKKTYHKDIVALLE